MATPQFTPDGRLLQVEYAAAAATHSSPILVIPVLDDDDDEEENNNIIQAEHLKQPQQKQNHPTTSSNGRRHPNTALILLNLKSSRLTQDRFILLTPPGAPITSPTTDSKTPNQNVVVVAMSGIVADNIALLRHVHKAMELDFRTYGGSTRTSGSGSHQHCRFASGGGGAVPFILRAIADQCYVPTVGGGIRPFGSTMLVCGWEPTRHAAQQQTLVVWQCQPSGALQPVSLDQIHVVGGGDSTDQEVLKRLVQQGISDATLTAERGNHHLSRVLRGAVRALLAHRQRQQQLLQQTPTPSTSSSLDGSDQLDDDNNDLLGEAGLECVIVSPRHGVHRLSSHQIASLLSQCVSQQQSNSSQ